MGARHRPRRLERRCDLLVRGRRYRFVRARSRRDGMSRLPSRQRVSALRRRGAATAALRRAVARRFAAGDRDRRRRRRPLRRDRADRGRHVTRGRDGVPRQRRRPRGVGGSTARMSLRDHWDEHADSWAAFARTPGHDFSHEETNFPPFLELLPPPGRATLDVGCGEGRVGAELQRLGYKVIGVDSSPRMVEFARERHEAIVADAAALPFDDGAFDLVIAYMSLMNLDDMEGGVREAARVLERGGRFCFAVLHPLFAAGELLDPDDPDSPFLIRGYFDAPTK